MVSQFPPLCSLSSHAAAICPILIIIHKHNKTGFPLSFIYSVVIQIHYLQLQINSSRPSAPLTYLGRHSYSWPNSLNKISRHYNAAAITTRQSSPLSRLNYISQQHVSFFFAWSSHSARTLAICAVWPCPMSRALAAPSLSI